MNHMNQMRLLGEGDSHDHLCSQVRHRYRNCTATVTPNGSISNPPHDGHFGAVSYARRPFRVLVRRSRRFRRSGFSRDPSIGADNRAQTVPVRKRQNHWVDRYSSGGGQTFFLSRRVSETASEGLRLARQFQCSGFGGGTTSENLELRCRAHNAYEAQLFFGPPVVREEGAPFYT